MEQRNYIYQHSRIRENSACKCVLSITAGKMIRPDSYQEDSFKVVCGVVMSILVVVIEYSYRVLYPV